MSCDPTKFPLKLVQVDYEYDTAMNTWKNLRFRLPPAVRARHLSDPVFGSDWSALLQDFDKKPSSSNRDLFFVYFFTDSNTI